MERLLNSLFFFRHSLNHRGIICPTAILLTESFIHRYYVFVFVYSHNFDSLHAKFDKYLWVLKQKCSHGSQKQSFQFQIVFILTSSHNKYLFIYQMEREKFPSFLVIPFGTLNVIFVCVVGCFSFNAYIIFHSIIRIFSIWMRTHEYMVFID